MLRLQNITKDYKVADTKVHALRGLSLSFRENEFVSILGPSGCGKTTLLNIVGGLDKYTSGNLFISGRSTKEFKDRDWDVYRNHRVGFIFQSYNLIPHQTVLANVELALTIAGLNKAERIQKAKAALDKVGLTGQYYKRPNQLSGGQSQRVAIARALVNDPEILLADEPTGALDTVTSLQIMELIHEIAKERLVIMVTHNPELAQKYSTRIIRLLDGELISDSNPYSAEDESKEKRVGESAIKKERAKMSFFTAFKLSLHNLFSKKARTLMTSIAGSIGIIGVSLVLSLSYGIQAFIVNMQDDMLSGNPITISQTGFDINALMGDMNTQTKVELVKEFGFVNVEPMMSYLAERASSFESMMFTNNITRDYMDYVEALPKEDAAAVHMNYGVDVSNSFYTDFYQTKDVNAQNISLATIKSIYSSVLQETSFKSYASYITGLNDAFAAAPASEEYLLQQYNMLDGRFATQKNELMIVLNEDSRLTDLLLAQLGYYSQEEFINIVYKIGEDDEYNPSLDIEKFSYEQLMDKTFVWYPNDEIFYENTNPFTKDLQPYLYNAYSNSNFKDGIQMKVVGILEPREDLFYGSLTSGFYYTEALTQHIIESNKDSELVKYFKDNDLTSFGSMKIEVGSQVMYQGITYTYDYTYNGQTHTQIAFVGKVSQMMGMISMIPGMSGGDDSSVNIPDIYYLSLQEIGGSDIASIISIYPVDFDRKANVIAYLDAWNNEGDLTINGKTLTSEKRDEIKYTDTIAIIISLVNSLINIVTFALVGFTALSLVVSCVMIGIITYVSVVERIKEIGVIRSLGGRKKDVSYLFNAETFIIGFASGTIGILVTYALSGIINLIMFSINQIRTIALFPFHYAAIMMCISVCLTLISGLLPSRSAARKDPVVALRTE